MSQLHLSSDASLLVRDGRGRYRPASPEQILAAARRVVDDKMRRGDKFSTPTEVKTYLRAKLAGFDHEVFAVLFVDAQNRLVEYVEMFRGTIDGTTVHAREVVKEALRCNAAAAIFSHNHPSGNAVPSAADREVTQRLADALALVDVRTLDHIVVAGDTTTSFVERGLL